MVCRGVPHRAATWTPARLDGVCTWLDVTWRTSSRWWAKAVARRVPWVQPGDYGSVLPNRSRRHRDTVRLVGDARTNGAGITFALPDACQAPQASPSWTDRTCFGVSLWCRDKCTVPDPASLVREVSGNWYPCGVCFGLPF